MKLAVFHHDKAGMNQKHCRDADHPRYIARFAQSLASLEMVNWTWICLA